MDESDYGRFVPRGGRKIEVAKAADAFTAMVRGEGDVATLAAPGAVRAVRSLTAAQAHPYVVEATVAEQDRDTVMDELRRDHGLVVHHEYVTVDESGTRIQITDEIIAEFAEGTSTETTGAILEAAGVAIKKDYGPRSYLLVVTDAAGGNPIKVANRLEAYDEVVYAEPVLMNRFATSAVPSDQQFRAQWHLSSANQTAPDIARDADVSVLEAWNTTKGRREIVVAVLDDGFDLTHPDFQGQGKVVEAVDFTGDDTVPLPESGDYHGTPCAGVAIAEENGSDCVGVAPGCAFMPVRFPLSATDAWLIEIFRYVSARAHVASCSWGPQPGFAPLHSAVAATFAELARTGGKGGNGLVIVFAAGNYDAPLNATLTTPVRWGGRDSSGQFREFSRSGRILNGSAAHPDVIAVSACTSLKRKSLYSNYGREIDVVAPSNNFHPVTIGRLPGRGITTVDNEPFGDDFTPGKRYTNSFGGTSSACPLVAGVAALVRSANPALTALDVKAVLTATADKITDPSTDPLYGHAKGSYDAQGHSEWFGHGRVNAAAAVAEAVRRLPAPPTVIDRERADRIAIPDADRSGISSTLEIAEVATIASVAVEVDITHPWIGDLLVSLISPAGTSVTLHAGMGAGTDDIRRTFTAVEAPGLGWLAGSQAQGTWRLNVADRARRDVGALNRWRLRLTTA